MLRRATSVVTATGKDHQPGGQHRGLEHRHPLEAHAPRPWPAACATRDARPGRGCGGFESSSRLTRKKSRELRCWSANDGCASNSSVSPAPQHDVADLLVAAARRCGPRRRPRRCRLVRNRPSRIVLPDQRTTVRNHGLDQAALRSRGDSSLNTWSVAGSKPADSLQVDDRFDDAHEHQPVVRAQDAPAARRPAKRSPSRSISARYTPGRCRRPAVFDRLADQRAVGLRPAFRPCTRADRRAC